MKIVINTAIGAYRLNKAVIGQFLFAKGMIQNPNDSVIGRCHCDIERHDPTLIKIIEAFGESANSPGTQLKIVDIPDGVEYIICDSHDGSEWIAEKHRTWE